MTGEPMPILQKIVMFFSVVGPFAAASIAIVMLWHSHGSVFSIGAPELVAMVVMYMVAGFGVTLGFHRLFTHRAFRAPRFVQLALAIFGSSAGQGMFIRWCATHRRHHQLSDRDGDPHSPHLLGKGLVRKLRGLWHAHVGWCFNADKPDLGRSVADLCSDPALLAIDRLYFLWVFLGLLLPAVVLGVYEHSWRGALNGLMWGGLVRIFLMQHVTWSVNSICHVWGRRPFKTADHSRNNFPVAILSLGEGWHNNHHAFPTSARHGLKWWQFDATYVLIRLMSWIGWARDIKTPGELALEAKRV